MFPGFSRLSLSAENGKPTSYNKMSAGHHRENLWPQVAAVLVRGHQEKTGAKSCRFYL